MARKERVIRKAFIQGDRKRAPLKGKMSDAAVGCGLCLRAGVYAKIWAVLFACEIDKPLTGHRGAVDLQIRVRKKCYTYIFFHFQANYRTLNHKWRALLARLSKGSFNRTTVGIPIRSGRIRGQDLREIAAVLRMLKLRLFNALWNTIGLLSK